MSTVKFHTYRVAFEKKGKKQQTTILQDVKSEEKLRKLLTKPKFYTNKKTGVKVPMSFTVDRVISIKYDGIKEYPSSTKRRKHITK